VGRDLASINGDVPGHAVPLAEAWRRFLEWAKDNLRRFTLERHTASWKAFRESGKPTTVEGIEAFKAWLIERGFKPATVNSRIGDVRAIFSRMIQLGVYRGPNPAAKITRLKLPKRPPKYLSTEQAEALLIAAKTQGRDMHLFVALCLLAGFRKGEAISARWEWVDWNAKTITVQASHGFTPKDSDCRTVPLSDGLLRILSEYRQPEGYAIRPGKELAKCHYRVEICKHYPHVAKAAGVPWCTPHVLRHTFASRLVQAGVSLYKVQVWLGHSNSATTQIYAHLQGFDSDVNRVPRGCGGSDGTANSQEITGSDSGNSRLHGSCVTRF
jgi:integrase